MNSNDDKEFLEKIESVLRTARNPTGARNIIALLFPKAEKVLKTYVPGDRMDRWEQKRSRRISQAEFALTYFGLDPSPLVWSREEIDEIIKSDNPESVLINARRRIEFAQQIDRPRLRVMLLDALNGAFEESYPFSQAWLDALIASSPYFIVNSDEDHTMFGTDNLERLRWALRSALDKMEVAKRSVMMLEAIEKAADLSLLCDFVRSYTSDWHPRAAGGDNNRSYFGEKDRELRTALLLRVRQVAAAGGLWSQANPSRILWFWWSCDNEEEVKRFTKSAMDELSSLRGMLIAPIGLVRSSNGNYESVAPYWSGVVDLDELALRAKALQESTANQDDYNLAERFLLALKRGKER